MTMTVLSRTLREAAAVTIDGALRAALTEAAQASETLRQADPDLRIRQRWNAVHAGTNATINLGYWDGRISTYAG